MPARGAPAGEEPCSVPAFHASPGAALSEEAHTSGPELTVGPGQDRVLCALASCRAGLSPPPRNDTPFNRDQGLWGREG